MPDERLTEEQRAELARLAQAAKRDYSRPWDVREYRGRPATFAVVSGYRTIADPVAVALGEYLAAANPETILQLLAENESLIAALRDAERLGQLESREEPKRTRCVYCGAAGIPARGIKPRHGDRCPFAILAAGGEENADGEHGIEETVGRAT